MTSIKKRPLLGWLILLVVVYLTFIGGSYLTDRSFGLRVFHHIFMTLLMGGWLLLTLIKRRAWPSTPLDLALAIYLMAAILVTAAAVDPRMSLEELWRLVIHFLMIIFLVDLMRTYSPRTVIEPIFFASSLVILFGMIEFISWYAGFPRLPMFPLSWLDVGGLAHPIPPEIHRISFVMLIATHLSAYLATLIPVGVAWAISTRSRSTRIALSLWLVGAVLVEVLSFSRGGLVSLAVSLSAFAILSLSHNADLRNRLRDLLRNRNVVGGAVFAIAAAGLMVWLWLRQSGAGGHRTGDVLRLDLWRSAWVIGLRHPILGVGLFGFGRALRPIRDTLVTPDFFVAPHNAFLLIWAEMGAVGILALLVLVTGVARAAFQRWRGAKGQEMIRVSAAIAAILGLCVQSLFDTFSNSLPVLLPMLAMVAYLCWPKRPTEESRSRRWLPAAALGLILLGSIGWVFSDRAQSHAQAALSLRESGQLEAALAEIDQARQMDPAMQVYAAQRAQVLGELAQDDPQRMEEALAAYREMLTLESSSDVIHANYAMLLTEAGNPAEGLAEMRRTSAILPSDARYHLWVAELASEAGEQSLAESEYKQVFTFAPQWSISRYWEETPQRTAARDRFLSRTGLAEIPLEVLSQIPAVCWRTFTRENSSNLFCDGMLDLARGDPQGALVLLDQAINGNAQIALYYAGRARARMLAADSSGALLDAKMAVFLGDTKGGYVLGQLAEQRGDLAEAEFYYQQSNPIMEQSQGWELALFSRRAHLKLLRIAGFEAPGFTTYDLAPVAALASLYQSQGREADLERLLQQVQAADPYGVISAGGEP